FAYTAKISGRVCIVKENKVTGTECYERIMPGTVEVSPDGARTAYVASEGKQQFVVLGGKQQQSFDEIALLALSPDWSKLVYSGRRGRTWIPVVNGRTGGSFDDFISEITYSADTQRLAFVGSRRGRRLLVVDNREHVLPPNVEAGNLAFSFDGKRFAFKEKS